MHSDYCTVCCIVLFIYPHFTLPFLDSTVLHNWCFFIKHASYTAAACLTAAPFLASDLDCEKFESVQLSPVVSGVFVMFLSPFVFILFLRLL